MKKSVLVLGATWLATVLLAGCGGNASRDTIRAVGSSTVLPFAKLVSEEFAKQNSQFKAPIIEGNGTGGGMKLFCAGVGAQHPDIVNASRRMKKSEFDDCAKHGVADIAEIQVGIDGIAFANARGAPVMALTPVDVYKAVAANPFGKPNTARTWHDVNPSLPDMPILVYGPATISGTRDALKELILTKACESDPAIRAIKQTDQDRHDKICGDLRMDGAYADTADNYNLIVQKLEANPTAVGIFGYSYLESNADKLQGLTIGGVAPTYATIADFTYPGARPLFNYVKLAHVGAVPGLREYVAQWARLWGTGGPLAKAGMIAMPADLQEKSARAAAELTALDSSTLK